MQFGHRIGYPCAKEINHRCSGRNASSYRIKQCSFEKMNAVVFGYQAITTGMRVAGYI